MADVLITKLGLARLTWGGTRANQAQDGAARKEYLQALRRADQGQLDDLIRFARS
jgi:hypothetical protein